MDKAKFYLHVRAKFGSLAQSQVAGFEAVLDAVEGLPLAYASYMLATSWHETNRTMEPVREAYWLTEAWRRAHLKYYPWYGRGYVQLTWRENYDRADRELGLDGQLLITPDDAMKPEIAAPILRIGMEQGWFTGVRLRDCLPSEGVATREQYMNARTIINGRDKADLIEDYAQVFEKALRNGGWE